MPSTGHTDLKSVYTPLAGVGLWHVVKGASDTVNQVVFRSGARIEQPLEHLAELGCVPGLWNNIVEAVVAESGHDRRIRITARNDQFDGRIQFLQFRSRFHAAHAAAYRQVQQDRIENMPGGFCGFVQCDCLSSVPGALYLVTQIGQAAVQQCSERLLIIHHQQSACALRSGATTGDSEAGLSGEAGKTMTNSVPSPYFE